MIDNVYHKPEEEHSYITRIYRHNITLTDYELQAGEGIGAGCGKTTQLIRDVHVCKNPLVLCSTNKAIDPRS